MKKNDKQAVDPTVNSRYLDYLAMLQISSLPPLSEWAVGE